ncbi:ABC transporter permease [Rhizobium sp. Leaf341]|uniref:ABC transporter permease n=1 Tax=Rhizobium sp. Leaf341 TaxID=1736344 RepID=UPI000B2416C2
MTMNSIDIGTAAMTTPSRTTYTARSRLLRVVKDLLANPSSGFGFVVITILLVTALVAPWIAPYEPNMINLGEALQPPSAGHLFGTDELGRDVLSRIIHGSRISLAIITIVSVIVGPLGLLVGTTAGYFGGWYDTVMMRITDIFLSFPSLILSLAFVAALGASLENAIIAIGLTAWPPIARLARAETLTFRNADYISASRMQGASRLRIIIKSIMPMCLPSVLVRVTLSMATVILTAAGLGFLGLGAQPPLPEWGAMIATGRRYMLDNWWLVAFPGGAILLVSLAFNLLGDGLRDALDPKQGH